MLLQQGILVKQMMMEIQLNPSYNQWMVQHPQLRVTLEFQTEQTQHNLYYLLSQT